MLSNNKKKKKRKRQKRLNNIDIEYRVFINNLGFICDSIISQKEIEHCCGKN